MTTAAQPRVADRYRIVQLLGAGGMGRVWLARDEMLGRDVAIKEVILPAELSADQRAEQHARTLREAQTAARLNHPNVVKIYDVVRSEERPWIVMEYVQSNSLHELITVGGPLEPARAARIGLAILDALTAAHRSGVLHRDVKPGNVLVTSDDRVVLTDFGLATYEGADPSLTRPGLVLGSPQYVAPERARDGTSSVQTDLWSLGATLYAAVEGRSPYQRSTAMGTLTALATSAPDPAPHAGALAPVLAALLRRDPRERPGPERVRDMLTQAAEGSAGRPRRRLVPRPRRGGAAPHPPAVQMLHLDPAQAVTRNLGPTASGAPVAGPGGTAPAGHGSGRRLPIVLAALALVVVVGGGALALHRTHSPRADPGTTGAPARPGAPADPALGTRACPTIGPAPLTPASRRPAWSALAGGWVWYLDPTGFRIGVPPDWRLYRGTDGVCFREPYGQRLLGVTTWTPDGSSPPGRAALEHVTARESALLAGAPQLAAHRVVLGPVGYSRDAADWEYTYTDPGGTLMHSQVRDIVVAPGVGYTLVWATPELDWATNINNRLLALVSFTPPEH